MDSIIIAHYNSVVKQGDVVYDLGDFSFANPVKYLPRFNVQPIRIKGSHDHDLKEPRMLVIKPNNLVDNEGAPLVITLCHYAMRSWELSHYGSWHLFGHHHGLLPPYGLSFDVGVDSWDFFPVSLTQIRAKMATLRPIVNMTKR